MKSVLNKTNYIIIAISLAVIIIGFCLMSGSTTYTEFNPDVFSFRRITVAPVVCAIGFVGMIFGIMFKKKDNK
ncbi:MAG: DUF3098 domain-containing protein [Paludibacteraceae bacterium]|nr:DUF3098 domain-containing protein [Paludibacteraceae bacterium]